MSSARPTNERARRHTSSWSAPMGACPISTRCERWWRRNSAKPPPQPRSPWSSRPQSHQRQTRQSRTARSDRSELSRGEARQLGPACRRAGIGFQLAAVPTRQLDSGYASPLCNLCRCTTQCVGTQRDVIMPYRKPRDGSDLPEWKEELNADHRKQAEPEMFLHHRAGERAEQQEPLVALGQPDGVCPPSSWRVARPSGRSLQRSPMRIVWASPPNRRPPMRRRRYRCAGAVRG